MNTTPFPGDQENAAPYRGRALRVRRIDLNEPLPKDLEGATFVSGFALHPALDVQAVDEQGRLLPARTIVVVGTKVQA